MIQIIYRILKKANICFLILLCYGCNYSTRAVNVEDSSSDISKMFDIIIKFQNINFSEITPVRNELSIFFNDKSCASCIIDLNAYVNTMKRKHNVDVNFYTSLDNKNLNGIDRMIPTLNKIAVDTMFSNLEYPIIFQTDGRGRIFNCLPVNSSYLYVSFDYIRKYITDHSLQEK